MTKRIFSGLFILTSVGALGIILAGALAEGDQLIVRFLTAVVVAALGLYVVSDLRLQSSQTELESQIDLTKSLSVPMKSKISINEPPAESTAAYMATVAHNESTAFSFGKQKVSAGSSGFAGDLDSIDMGDPFGSEQDQDLTSITDFLDSEETDVFDDGLTNLTLDNEQYSWPISGEWPAIDGKSFDKNSSGLGALEENIEELENDFKSIPLSLVPDLDVKDREAFSGDDLVHLVEKQEKKSDEKAEEIAELPPTENKIEDLVEPEIAKPEVDIDLVEQNAVESEIDLTEQNAVAAVQTAEVEVVSVPNARTDEDEGSVSFSSEVDLRKAHSVEFKSNVDGAIKAGEEKVVSTLIEQGMLSTEGKISDRDVRTMVYVAFTSNELRKLIKAGGSLTGPNSDVDLGPVELFDESLHAPAPKTLYEGKPVELEAGKTNS